MASIASLKLSWFPKLMMSFSIILLYGDISTYVRFSRGRNIYSLSVRQPKKIIWWWAGFFQEFAHAFFFFFFFFSLIVFGTFSLHLFVFQLPIPFSGQSGTVEWWNQVYGEQIIKTFFLIYVLTARSILIWHILK